MISIIVPAFNEQQSLPTTLASIVAAIRYARVQCEMVVVDNNSTDDTAAVARSFGATVVQESRHNISSVRNRGATQATGDILVFVDADTRLPEALLTRISELLRDPLCLGGSVAVAYYDLKRRWTKAYLAGWRFWSRFFNMAQGATQFCRKSDFAQLGGYDTTVFVGEDIEFYWRLAKLARQRGGRVELITEMKVMTSGRRFSKMPIWKVLVLTHPGFVWLMWRRPGIWSDWYERAVR